MTKETKAKPCLLIPVPRQLLYLYACNPIQIPIPEGMEFLYSALATAMAQVPAGGMSLTLTLTHAQPNLGEVPLRRHAHGVPLSSLAPIAGLHLHLHCEDDGQDPACASCFKMLDRPPAAPSPAGCMRFPLLCV